MKKGMTIQQAAEEIKRQSVAKADYLVKTDSLHMETCDGVPTLRLLNESGIDQIFRMPFKSFGMVAFWRTRKSHFTAAGMIPAPTPSSTTL